jgi:hypothetical protein
MNVACREDFVSKSWMFFLTFFLTSIMGNFFTQPERVFKKDKNNSGAQRNRIAKQS